MASIVEKTNINNVKNKIKWQKKDNSNWTIPEI